MTTIVKYSILLSLLCALACGAQNHLVANHPTMEVEYTGAQVILEDALTRMQCKLIGTPHTAARIDSIHLIGSDKSCITAIDIDGVDFCRWFQWEDEPVIDIEIDFPVTYYHAGDTLLFFGPRGNIRSIIPPGK